MQGQIHIGTSGWSYKHWKDIFYPAGVKPAHYLDFYASHFSVSEVNASFYKLPTQKTVEKWVKMVPEHFIFCPKMSRYLSHLKKLHDPEEPLERFFNIFDPFHARLGPVLVQLPKNATFKPDVVGHCYNILKDRYHNYQFALEVRHESWFSAESLDLMKQYSITLVFAHSAQFPYREELTSNTIFVRFHGPESLYGSLYSESDMRKFAGKFFDWKKRGHRIWAFFNNDIHGHAITNAKMLQQYINELSA